MEDTILIVEDNPTLREGLCEILEFEGFNTLTAGHGQEALDVMENQLPSLILADISMPVMDGFEFFGRVREREDWLRIPFIFLSARSDKPDILKGKQLGAEDYLVKPVDHDELITAVRSRMERNEQLAIAQLRDAYQGSLLMLANAIELRDRYTRGHVERVTMYSLAIAEELGWDSERLEIIRFGGILHDVGKIHVRETTLRKTGSLDDAEWAEIRQHPQIGADMIATVPYLKPMEGIVRYHHERFDGKGYPYGIGGQDIPIEARIVAIADSFDAITSNRTYRPKLTFDQAYEEILRCAGDRYDPEMVEAFKQTYLKTGLLNLPPLS